MKQGKYDGELAAKWKAVPSAKSYLLQISPDPMTPDTWEFGDVSTKASYTAKNLDSGKKFWMRVCAIGAAGQGSWSDPAVKVAP